MSWPAEVQEEQKMREQERRTREEDQAAEASRRAADEETNRPAAERGEAARVRIAEYVERHLHQWQLRKEGISWCADVQEERKMREQALDQTDLPGKTGPAFEQKHAKIEDAAIKQSSKVPQHLAIDEDDLRTDDIYNEELLVAPHATPHAAPPASHAAHAFFIGDVDSDSDHEQLPGDSPSQGTVAARIARWEGARTPPLPHGALGRALATTSTVELPSASDEGPGPDAPPGVNPVTGDIAPQLRRADRQRGDRSRTPRRAMPWSCRLLSAQYAQSAIQVHRHWQNVVGW